MNKAKETAISLSSSMKWLYEIIGIRLLPRKCLSIADYLVLLVIFFKNYPTAYYFTKFIDCSLKRAQKNGHPYNCHIMPLTCSLSQNI